MDRMKDLSPDTWSKIRPLVFFFAVLLCRTPGIEAQESILVSYERNFIRANLATKSSILRDAATDERAGEFIGALYDFALSFTLKYADILRDDPDMHSLAVTAAQGVRRVSHTAAADALWKIFQAYRDSLIRVETLNSLGVLGKGNTEVVENLNQFLVNQNNFFRSGVNPDFHTLSACINALAGLDDASSFPVLFSAMLAGYPENIKQEAVRALSSLSGDYKSFLITVIRRNPPAEKLAAFNAASAGSRFKDAELGEIAEAALNTALEASAAGEISAGSTAATSGVLAELRYQAVRVISRLKWKRAADGAVKHFYKVREDYLNKEAGKEQFIEAVDCLGVMGNSDTAQVLALQLGLCNSQMERSGEYDRESVLAIIRALGEIGDKTAFDYLLYVGYLSYPDDIQAAAKDSLARLKW